MSPFRSLRHRLRPATALRALLADEAGAAALTLGLVAPAAFAAVGLGVDVGIWYTQRHQLQVTADLAALAGAQELSRGRDEALIRAAVADAAAKNGLHPDADHSLEVEVDNRNDGTSIVHVVATRRSDRLFSGIFLSEDPVIRAEADAEFVPPDTGAICVLGLDTERAETVEIQGTALADLGCAVMSNSMHAASLEVAGNGYLAATRIEAFGGIATGSNATVIGPRVEGAWPIEDPYGPARRNLQPSSASACDSTNRKVNNKNNQKLSPGRYCNGLSISNSNVTFEPGVYVIYDGDLDVSGTSSLTGHGVVFVLTANVASQIGQVKIPGGTKLDLSAPNATATGAAAPYHGVLFYQDGRAPSFQGNTLRKNSVQGGSGDRIEGALYFPAQEVFFTGGMTANDRCLQVVARKVTLTGNAAVRHGESACTNLGVTPIRRGGARLVS